MGKKGSFRRHPLIPTEKRERQYDGRDKKRTGSRQKGVVSTLPSPHSHPELGPGHFSAGFLEGFKMKGTLGLLHSEFPMADSIDLLYSTKPITHTVLCLTPRGTAKHPTEGGRMARRPQQLPFPLSPAGDGQESSGLYHLLDPISLPLPPKQESL